MDEDWSLAAVIVVFLVILIGGIWWLVSSSNHEETVWRAFRDARHCRVVGHVKEQTAVTSGGNVAFVGAQDTWLCDDGITYTRERE